MSTALKLRRGTTAQHSSFTGAAGEITVDTDKKTVVVHDGVTAGGKPLPQTDANGNLGLSVTPSAWGLFKAIEIGSRGNSISAYDSGGLYVGSNNYFNGTNWIYKITAPAAQYYSADGKHVWQTSASGTAGNAISFTQAMTLNASAQLLVGATTDYGFGGKILTRGGGVVSLSLIHI
jgi:hypothetical protein